MIEEVKYCPVCGKKPEISTYHTESFTGQYVGRVRKRVLRCPSCDWFFRVQTMHLEEVHQAELDFIEDLPF